VKGELLASMAHELRTPLNTIIGFTELMYDGRVGAVSDEHHEYLGDILASAKHLLRLINDVLDLAKLESGTIELAPELIDPSRLMSEVRDLVRVPAAQRQIRIAVAVDPNVGEIVLDPTTLKQVLYDCVSNALRFSAPGSHVSLRALPDAPGMFRVEVEDEAVGLRFHAVLPRTMVRTA
jgi:signal transduction histidine kinase